MTTDDLPIKDRLKRDMDLIMNMPTKPKVVQHTDDLPEAFRPLPLQTQPSGDNMPEGMMKYRSGYNACLTKTKAADLYRENERLSGRLQSVDYHLADALDLASRLDDDVPLGALPDRLLESLRVIEKSVRGSATIDTDAGRLVENERLRAALSELADEVEKAATGVYEAGLWESDLRMGWDALQEDEPTLPLSALAPQGLALKAAREALVGDGVE